MIFRASGMAGTGFPEKLKPVLLDTGQFGLSELIVLSDFHFAFYTGDVARPDF